MQTLTPAIKARILWLIMLILFIPGLVGLFHPGFFVSDDGNWMIIRFSAFYEALRSGQFPVRFLPRLLNGYGYPVSDFLYPLFMYLGVPIHIVGVDFINTVKIIFGLSFICSGVFSFFWLRRLFNMSAGFVGALAYVYFPYHLFDLYKRGSMGEMLALSIVPFILWQIERKSFLWVGLGIGLLIPAHNTLALLFLPVLLFYYFMREKNVLHVLQSLTIGLGMAAFFWLPALIDKQYTIFDSKTISVSSEYFLTISTYYLIGIIGIFGFVTVVLGIVRKQMHTLFWGITFLISLFFALPISQFFWHIVPLTKYVQFPFRFLSLTALAVSFASAYFVFLTKSMYKKIVMVGLIVIIFISALPAMFPTQYQNYPDGWYSTNQDSTTVQNEYLPMWVDTIPDNKVQLAKLVKGEGDITSASQKGSEIMLAAKITKSAILQINTIYFPGWDVRMDNKKMSIVYSNSHGLMQIALPIGTHIIKATFRETPLRIIADLISFVTILLVCMYALLQYRRQ